jgi:hypothetical protein
LHRTPSAALHLDQGARLALGDLPLVSQVELIVLTPFNGKVGGYRDVGAR